MAGKSYRTLASRTKELPLSEASCAAGYGISNRSTGDVTIVVTSVITTIMAKSVGEMTLRSSPMLRTMSSISPRVFISVPRAAALRQPRPVSRAATKVPPNFPTVATRMISPQMNHLVQACH